MRTKHEIILNVYSYIVRCSICSLIVIGIIIVFLINHFQWIIGFFDNENKYSDNWLTTTGIGSQTEYWSKWPTKHVTATMIIKRKQPHPSWNTFPVKIIEIFGMFKYFLISIKYIFYVTYLNIT